MNVLYNPQYIDEFYIDKQLKDILYTLIKIDNLNILFTGDNGTGKTYLINALINEYLLNNKTEVLRVTSLKDQGIHLFRQTIKTFCQVSSQTKRIISIDDIDILNDQCQQIVRNCIDKYNYKVHFICSCTNIQKVSDTIQSRTNILKLNLLNEETLLMFLNNLCQKHTIHLSLQSKKLLIKISNNSIKIVLNNIRKLLLYNSNKIEYNTIQKICTTIDFTLFDTYTKTWFHNKNILDAYQVLIQIVSNGYSVIDILECYYSYCKQCTTIDEPIKFKILPIIAKYINIFYSFHEDEYELILFTKNLVDILK